MGYSGSALLCIDFFIAGVGILLRYAFAAKREVGVTCFALLVCVLLRARKCEVEKNKYLSSVNWLRNAVGHL